MAPTDVCVLTPRICEYVHPYMAKRDFADVIKLGILRWRDYPGLSQWPNIIRKVLKRGRREGLSQGRSDDNGAGAEVMRDHTPRKAGSLWTSLAVQWLRLRASTAGAAGLTPGGRGSSACHKVWQATSGKPLEVEESNSPPRATRRNAALLTHFRLLISRL